MSIKYLLFNTEIYRLPLHPWQSVYENSLAMVSETKLEAEDNSWRNFKNYKMDKH